MTEIELLLQQNGISYINKGKSLKVKCLNPSHEDKHPSMSIDSETGVFHCFSCGFSGNKFTLNKLLTGKNDYDPNYKFTISLRENTKKNEQKYSVPKIFGTLLNPIHNKEVMKFLRSIGIRDEQIEKFGIKYTSYSEMISEDLLNDKNIQYTKMYNRICIPIYHNKILVNYECRTFNGDTPKVKYVRGCSVNTIFNYDNLDFEKPVVVTESIKNMLKIWNVNANCCSIFHNILTDVQAEMFKKCKNIILFLDNDKGGFGDIDKDGNILRKGMLQSFVERGFIDNLYLCWDNRVYWVTDDDKKFMKGYDANDCTLDEIKGHIDNIISYNDYIKNKSIKKIYW